MVTGCCLFNCLHVLVSLLHQVISSIEKNEKKKKCFNAANVQDWDELWAPNAFRHFCMYIYSIESGWTHLRSAICIYCRKLNIYINQITVAMLVTYFSHSLIVWQHMVAIHIGVNIVAYLFQLQLIGYGNVNPCRITIHFIYW